MQISLPTLINQFFDALSTPQGLVGSQGIFLSAEQYQSFQVCAVLVGLSPDVMREHENGLVSVDPLTAQFVRKQLIAAGSALKKLPHGKFQGMPYLIEEFAVDADTVLDTPAQTPELNRLLRGTYMMAVTKDDRGAYRTLTTTLSTRGEAIDAIETLRPDIASALRKQMAEIHEDANSAGQLPATRKQIRDLQHSYRAVVKAFEQGEDIAKAQETLEAIRAESQPKPIVVERASEGKIISRELPGGKRAVVLSTRPREESTEHFMVELDVMQPLLDLCKHAASIKGHTDGREAKYCPSKGESGEYWLRAPSLEIAEYQRNMLRTLLQDGAAIQIETDTTNRKHPDYWITIPRDLFEKIQDEATLIHDLRDDVRRAFESGDRQKAQELKDELLEYVNPRIYVGEHAAALQKDHETGVQASR